jgi:MSHA biogenesis protein MshJ
MTRLTWPKLTLANLRLPRLGGATSVLKPLTQRIRPQWRQVRRQFDSRQPNERKLLIIAAVSLVWFVGDALLITPAIAQIRAASKREAAATAAKVSMQGELNRKRVELANQMLAAQQEQVSLRERLAQGKEELERQQAMLAPASEMRNLLEGLLAQGGRLRVVGMRTQAPKEVSFPAGTGRDGGTPPMLFKHGLEISLNGQYLELLQWLRGVENLPRRLLCDSLTLTSDEHARLTLTLVVHTFSHDRDALEIAP